MNGPKVNKALKTLRQHIDAVVDTVLPPRCAASGEIVEQQGMISNSVFRDLNFIMDPMCRICGAPFAYDMGEGACCASCLDLAPGYDTARSALVYDDVSRKIILKFKHADQLHIVHTFSPWLLQVGTDMLSAADYIIPVPLHRGRLLKRRYNQAGMIAKMLSNKTDVTWLPDALVRKRATLSQGHLGAKDRYANVKGAFALKPDVANRFSGKTIVLVDDVLTSGATVSECAKILKSSGASQVHVLTVARAVKGDF